MSETKHTPGPWTAHWSKYRDGVFVVQAGQPSNRILADFDGDGDGPDEQSLADAHLIAAAPDMFEALRYAETRCVSEAAYPHASIEDRKMRDLIVAAISKAEGSQP